MYQHDLWANGPQRGAGLSRRAFCRVFSRGAAYIPSKVDDPGADKRVRARSADPTDASLYVKQPAAKALSVADQSAPFGSRSEQWTLKGSHLPKGPCEDHSGYRSSVPYYLGSFYLQEFFDSDWKDSKDFLAQRIAHKNLVSWSLHDAAKTYSLTIITEDRAPD